MSEISIYLLSIVGVVMLSVILDLVLPSGQVNKYIKGIMSLVIIFVIASPIPKFVQNGLDFSLIEVTLDENYLEKVESQQKSLLKNNLETLLNENGIENAELEIWGKMEDGELKITYIFVETENVVLSGEFGHINKYEAIKNLLVKQTGISESQVVFNG